MEMRKKLETRIYQISNLLAYHNHSFETFRNFALNFFWPQKTLVAVSPTKGFKSLAGAVSTIGRVLTSDFRGLAVKSNFKVQIIKYSFSDNERSELWYTRTKMIRRSTIKISVLLHWVTTSASVLSKETGFWGFVLLRGAFFKFCRAYFSN